MVLVSICIWNLQLTLIGNQCIRSHCASSTSRGPATMAGTHNWERKRRAWEATVGSDSEAAADADFFPECSDSEDESGEGEQQQDTAGWRVVNLIIYHILVSHLTAKQGMILLYWCALAGVKEAKKLMVSPDAPSGHFSRKF